MESIYIYMSVRVEVDFWSQKDTGSDRYIE